MTYREVVDQDPRQRRFFVTIQSGSMRSQHHDVVVIGTGMGGSAVGYALAKAGRKVLFIERGRSLLFSKDDVSQPLRGQYAEQFQTGREGVAPTVTLKNAGRACTPVIDHGRPFIPFAGCGTGGSTAIFGMVMQRFAPADFLGMKQLAPGVFSTPWPVSYDEMRPYYRRAEELFSVHGSLSPLRRNALDPIPTRPAIPADDPARELTDFFTAKGLHPYQPPMAVDGKTGCANCQGFLCPHPCRKDANEVFLRPALERYGATLITETEVTELVADQHAVKRAVCVKDGVEFCITADLFIVAAGALETPKLLLNSCSRAWPNGLANNSGLVGRYLTRKYFDLYLIYPKKAPGPATGKGKEIYIDDYFVNDRLGIVQSFGEWLPPEVMVKGLEADCAHGWRRCLRPFLRLIRPVLRSFLAWKFRGCYALTTTMEDESVRENRVFPSARDNTVPALDYRITSSDRKRIALFREKIAALLKPYHFMHIKKAHNNRMFIALAAGTCRFGDDPRTSVLDRNNRAHGIDNLYVVDSSFFPSSSSLNPALTIAANGLRVADRIVQASAKVRLGGNRSEQPAHEIVNS
jgi:choline dehydrogenase-like flavoprotein